MPPKEIAPVACNLLGLRDADRYKQLSTRLREAITGRAELPDGFSYSVDIGALTVVELGEWITLERQCCPFLSFEFTLPAGDGLCWLIVTGPEGAKEILDREFPG